MERKLVKQGQNALTVTLPSAWTKTNGLNAGGVVDLEISENKVIVSTNEEPKPKEIVLKIGSESDQVIKTRLIVVYWLGFDHIKVLFSTGRQERIIRKTVEEKLLGFEVIEANKEYLIIESVAEPSKEKQEILFKRVVWMIKNSFSEIAEDLHKKEFCNYSKVLGQNIIVIRYLNFLNRNTSRNKFNDERVSYHWDFHLKLILIQRSLLHLYSVLNEEQKIKLSPMTLKLFLNLTEDFSKLVEGYFQKDFSLLEIVGQDTNKRLCTDTYNLLKKTKGSENIVLYHCGELSRLINLASITATALIV